MNLQTVYSGRCEAALVMTYQFELGHFLYVRPKQFHNLSEFPHVVIPAAIVGVTRMDWCIRSGPVSANGVRMASLP